MSWHLCVFSLVSTLFFTLFLSACGGGDPFVFKGPLVAVSNVAVKASDSQVVVTWNTSVGATSYTVYLSSSSQLAADIMAEGQAIEGASSSVVVTGLDNSLRYYFLVTANTSLGETPASLVFDAVPHRPVTVFIYFEKYERITLELYQESAPITVANFIDYAESSFYDGTIFHRVVSNFIIQGGGLEIDIEKGLTEKNMLELPIVNEANNGLSNLVGTIAMARLEDADSATSQFFINVADNVSLDYASTQNPAGYAVFGRVTEGMDVVNAISKVSTATINHFDDVPVNDVLVNRIEITYP